MEGTAERSIHRAREAYARHYADRKSRSLKIISFNDAAKHVYAPALCKAVNVSGKACANQAFCNNLCKRHQQFVK